MWFSSNGKEDIGWTNTELPLVRVQGDNYIYDTIISPEVAPWIVCISSVLELEVFLYRILVLSGYKSFLFAYVFPLLGDFFVSCW